MVKDKKCDCALDRVALSNFLLCMYQSISDIFQDICNGNTSIETFTKNDRMLYLVGLLILCLSIRLLLNA